MVQGNELWWTGAHYSTLDVEPKHIPRRNNQNSVSFSFLVLGLNNQQIEQLSGMWDSPRQSGHYVTVRSWYKAMTWEAQSKALRTNSSGQFYVSTREGESKESIPLIATEGRKRRQEEVSYPWRGAQPEVYKATKGHNLWRHHKEDVVCTDEKTQLQSVGSPQRVVKKKKRELCHIPFGTMKVLGCSSDSFGGGFPCGFCSPFVFKSMWVQQFQVRR